MPSVPTPSKAGITTTSTGERHIPSSLRADGSLRKEIKIRPGYKPPEDVEVYKNNTAERFRTRGAGPPPGSASLIKANGDGDSTAASEKNRKRKEARRRAAEVAASAQENGGDAAQTGHVSGSDGGKAISRNVELEVPIDPEAEREKKARALRKKLKQARDLQEKKEDGAALLPEQFAKVIKIKELIRELEALGFGADEEVKETS